MDGSEVRVMVGRVVVVKSVEVSRLNMRYPPEPTVRGSSVVGYASTLPAATSAAAAAASFDLKLLLPFFFSPTVSDLSPALSQASPSSVKHTGFLRCG